LDVHIVDDLRNFLFSPGQGQDLAAINIQRGRDLGLGTLNETRISLGLTPYTKFSQITSDTATADALSEAYGGNINAIDLWIGGLAETPTKGAMIGETFGLIIAKQFEALRDGDRFWYQNQGFDQKTLSEIDHTSLSDIILRNTDTVSLQSDVFVAYERHSSSLDGVGASSSDVRQLVIGSTNGDTLVGGSLGDILVAGSGQQTLTGGKGSDIFVFGDHITNAKITDFKVGVDLINILSNQKLQFSDLHLRSGNGSTIVDVLTDHIELVGVTQGQLSAKDFVFDVG
jgi:Ca2+-binding RTX toxin-like protein